jgi:S1-C subfamily serine protease
VTNNHVVDGATSIHVTDIGNGKTYTAEIVGTDATSDIAVIQLEGASGLATANLGNSSSLKSDEPVLAIGNAGGTGGTPSTAAGEVVALNQSITATDDSGANSENLSGLVETDAPIEPGDSGGPLVNSSAQVLAIDTAASAGNQFQSASTEAYAIPIDTALSIADAIESGQASSTIHIGEAAMIGVEVETASEASGSSASGAYIAAIIPGTPAASAGLVAGEVIVSLNGQAVDSPSALSSLMSSHHPGDRVTIGFDNSSGQLETLTLTLAAGPPA